MEWTGCIYDSSSHPLILDINICQNIIYYKMEGSDRAGPELTEVNGVGYQLKYKINCYLAR